LEICFKLCPELATSSSGWLNKNVLEYPVLPEKELLTKGPDYRSDCIGKILIGPILSKAEGCIGIEYGSGVYFEIF
jgi:hypothetical protein